MGRDQPAVRRIFLDPVGEGRVDILVPVDGQAEEIGVPGLPGRVKQKRFSELVADLPLEIEDGQNGIIRSVCSLELEGVSNDAVRAQDGRAYAPVGRQPESVDVDPLVSNTWNSEVPVATMTRPFIAVTPTDIGNSNSPGPWPFPAEAALGIPAWHRTS